MQVSKTRPSLRTVQREKGGLGDRILTVVLGEGALARREAINGYLCTLPWLVGFLWLVLGPLILSFVMSFYEWHGFGEPRFVGLYNFKWMIGSDVLYHQALKVTANYALYAIPLQIILAFLIALLLNNDLFGVSAMRTLIYLPTVVSGVAVAFLWKYMLDTRYGAVNMLVKLLGFAPIPWLTSPKWALRAFILMGSWSIGGGMIIYLAGLKGIPPVFYEAATIDGANAWQKLWKITIPMVSPSLFYTLVTGTIGAFQIFTTAYVIGEGEGGPLNSTLFYVPYLYTKAFGEQRMGYASAMAWVLVVIIGILTALNFLVAGRRVHYEE